VIVVCDSGPLIHLWEIGLWSSFGTFETVHVPQQVVEEVQHYVELEEFERLSGCPLYRHPVTVEQLAATRATVTRSESLQLADIATLALADAIQPTLALTDDLALRQALEAHGHQPMGTVGIILRGYKHNLVERGALDGLVDKLFVQSTLYLSANFKNYVRKLVTEALEEKGDE
jgi:predicted nucleic acid-binding protein